MTLTDLEVMAEHRAHTALGSVIQSVLVAAEKQHKKLAGRLVACTCQCAYCTNNQKYVQAKIDLRKLNDPGSGYYHLDYYIGKHPRTATTFDTLQRSIHQYRKLRNESLSDSWGG